MCDKVTNFYEDNKSYIVKSALSSVKVIIYPVLGALQWGDTAPRAVHS